MKKDILTELFLIKNTAVDKHTTSALGERIGKNGYKNGNRLILDGTQRVAVRRHMPQNFHIELMIFVTQN